MKTFTGLFVFVLLAGMGLAQDLNRGIELYDAKKYDEAEGVLRQVIEKEADNARAHYYLGLALLAQNKAKEAETALQKADELESTDQTKLGLARAYLEQKQFGKAEEALNQAREKNPDSADLPYYRGMLNVSRKQFSAAAKDLETAIERNPENAYAHYYAGIAYNGVKRPDKMVEHFERFLKLAPDAPEAAKVQSLLRSAR